MTNSFVFQCRNPQYTWLVVAFVLLFIQSGLFFYISWAYLVVFMCINVAIIGIALLFTTSITIIDKELGIKKKFIGIIYKKYDFTIEHIAIKATTIDFTTKENNIISFIDNWCWEDPDEFSLYIKTNEIITLGGVSYKDTKDFDKFKVQLQE